MNEVDDLRDMYEVKSITLGGEKDTKDETKASGLSNWFV